MHLCGPMRSMASSALLGRACGRARNKGKLVVWLFHHKLWCSVPQLVVMGESRTGGGACDVQPPIQAKPLVVVSENVADGQGHGAARQVYPVSMDPTTIIINTSR